MSKEGKKIFNSGSDEDTKSKLSPEDKTIFGMKMNWYFFTDIIQSFSGDIGKEIKHLLFVLMKK